MEILPKAKLKNVVIQEFDQEVLIYDLERNKAFSLNETATFIWQKCDGKTTFSELKESSGGKFSDDLILMALKNLQKEKLLADNGEVDFLELKLPRRQLITKYGGLAVSLPMIVSLVAPTSTNAQSLQTMNCTALPIPYPSGCTFGSSAIDCPTCQNTLMTVTPTICQSGTSSIDSLCTPNNDPAFVNCTAICT